MRALQLISLLSSVLLGIGAAFAQPNATPTRGLETVNAFNAALPALASLITILGTALYFGALVRTKNTLSTMAQVALGACTAGVAWVLLAGELSLAQPNRNWLGPMTFSGVQDASSLQVSLLTMPLVLLVGSVLFGGAVERLRFSAVFIIALTWTFLVVAPILRAVQPTTGALSTLGFHDWIGAGSLNLAVGVSALGICIATGNRHGFGRIALPPYHLGLAFIGSLTMIMGWILCFLTASLQITAPLLDHAVTKLFISAMGGAMGWMVFERAQGRLLSTLGMVSGAIAGVAACSAVAVWLSPRQALLVGAAGAAAGYLGAVILRRVHQRDDSLDIFALHTLPALLGLLLLPLFYPQRAEFGPQLAGAVLTVVYAATITACIVVPLKYFDLLRVTFDEEDAGLDLTTHGETVHPPQSSL